MIPNFQITLNSQAYWNLKIRKDVRAMIKTSNHLGTITISKKYLVKQVTLLTESCFGVAGLKGVEISQQGNAVSIRLNVITTGEVNLPAVAGAISHKVAYVLVNKLGVDVSKIDVFTDDIMD